MQAEPRSTWESQSNRVGSLRLMISEKSFKKSVDIAFTYFYDVPHEDMAGHESA